MSDPHVTRWLADDPQFLDSLRDLDRGLADGLPPDGPGEAELTAFEDPPPLPPRVAPPAPPAPPRSTALPAAPRSAAVPVAPRPGPAPARPAAAPPPVRAINAARALDPARVLDTTPAPRSRRALAHPPVAAPELPEIVVPPLTFTSSSPSEPRSRRPLLDLFPPSALEPERPQMPAFGTAVGPQLTPRPRPAPPPEPELDGPSRLDAPSYEIFYGLREKPFSLSTDPRFQYQSAAHERAGQELLAALRKRGGPAVLTAPLGRGKTTLCRSLALELDRRTVTSLVFEPPQGFDDLLKTMLVGFGVVSREDLAASPHLSRDALSSTLGAFFDSLVPLQASAVVFIDEAQHLPVALLGELAAILGGDGPASRVLQVVLIGQPGLTALLKHADLRALNASVVRHVELGPLGAEEISSYVMHRLSIAGANTRIEFDDAAIARLFEVSGGSPRLVNLLCDRAMTRGHTASAAVIGVDLIDAAADDLDLQAPDRDGTGIVRSLLIVAAFALLVLAGAGAALYVQRDAVSRTILQWENVPLPPGGPLRRLPVPLAPIPPPADGL